MIGIAATITATALTFGVAWNAVVCDGYKVYWSQNLNKWQLIQTAPGSVSNLTVTIPRRGYIVLTATNSIGLESGPSNVLPLP